MVKKLALKDRTSRVIIGAYLSFLLLTQISAKILGFTAIDRDLLE